MPPTTDRNVRLLADLPEGDLTTSCDYTPAGIVTLLAMNDSTAAA